MERDSYRILATAQGWVLQWNGRHLSSFGDRSKAFRAAAAAARMSQARGRGVEVLTQNESGETFPVTHLELVDSV
jgi:hypothetical protein